MTKNTFVLYTQKCLVLFSIIFSIKCEFFSKKVGHVNSKYLEYIFLFLEIKYIIPNLFSTKYEYYQYCCRFLLVEFQDHRLLFPISDPKSFFLLVENSSSYFPVFYDRSFSCHNPELSKAMLSMFVEIHQKPVCHFYGAHFQKMIVVLFYLKVAIKKKKKDKRFSFSSFLCHAQCISVIFHLSIFCIVVSRGNQLY